MKTIVCIPAYNEENNISNVIHGVSKYADLVLVCDDGSTDNTSKEAKNAGAYLVSHKSNQGKGAALKTLFSNAKKIGFDVLVTIDGDGQFYSDDVSKLIKPISEGKADIVIGNRFEHSGEMPSYRKLGNKMFDRLTSAASDLPIVDTQSGIRGYSSKAINEINFSSKGFAADSEILMSIAKKPLRIIEENVKVKYKTGAKTSTQDPITHGADIITHLLETVAIRRPLLLLGLPGLIFTIVALFFSTIAITLFNETGYFSVPNTVIAVGFFLTGILMILTAAILFAIGKLFEKNRLSQDETE